MTIYLKNFSATLAVAFSESTKKLPCVSSIAMSLVALQLAAGEVDERELYDLAPENSSFVRLINLSNQPQKFQLNRAVLSVGGYCSASSYQYITAGDHNLKVESGSSKNTTDRELVVSVASSQAYSVVVDNVGVRLVADRVVRNPRKSLVSVYNFSSLSDLSVKTSDGKHTVFYKIDKDSQLSREINPVKVDFSIFSKNESLTNVATEIFERGVASTLLLCGDKQSLITQWVRQ